MANPKILKSTPFRRATFPPPFPRREHKVQTGESWVSLASTNGRSDPWDIIEYNFNTRDPREVNWYLEKYVGCTTSSDDKNYSFATSDSPGKIYIPHRSWTPNTDLDLRRLVTSALADNVVSRVNVFHAGHTISVRSLHSIANRVIDREIGVVRNAKLKEHQAEYVPGTNTFHLGFDSAPSRERKGLIVHEAVHAALDMQKASGMLISEAESFAYVVQCFYVREYQKHIDNSRLTDPVVAKDKVYELAWEMAATLAKGTQPDFYAWHELDKAVCEHPDYKKNAGDFAEYDGI